MKRSLFIGLIMLPFFISGQPRLQAYLSYSSFLSPVDGPYLETYLAIDASSLEWITNKDGDLSASVEVTLIFWLDSAIINFKKYDLLPPVQSDSTELDFNIVDLQRFALPNGKYNLEIKLKDKAVDSMAYTTTEPIEINFPELKLCISGIQLVDSYKKTVAQSSISKSGFDLVPYVFSFYPDGVNTLRFYSEFYNTNKELGDSAGLLAITYLQPYEIGGQINNTLQRRRLVAKPVNALLSEIDIKELPSGNYYIVIELRDRDNNLLTINRQFIQRSNPDVQFDTRQLDAVNTHNTFVDEIVSIDSLSYFIRSLAPIATEIEKTYSQNGLNSDSPELMRKYFYSFWAVRSPSNPGSGWIAYRAHLKKANELYGTPIKAGFESDRGRVYLQYGAPNVITKESNDPSAYPYEIWHYYTLQNQSNKKFVFYNPDLVTNDYELIHSDALGEVYNSSWQMLIYRRDTPSHNIDDTGDRQQWGSRSKQYFNNPY